MAVPISGDCSGDVEWRKDTERDRSLYDDIAAAFTVLPPKGSSEEAFWQYETATVKRRGHGRTDTYIIESTTALNHYLDFPEVAQVIRRTRRSLDHTTRRLSVSVEYLITSLDRTRVTLEQVELFRSQRHRFRAAHRRVDFSPRWLLLLYLFFKNYIEII